MTEILLITGMLFVTYSVRLLPFAFAGRLHLPAIIRNSLTYVPVAVLSAIIAPALLMPKGDVWLDWNNPYLMAGITSVVAAYLSKNLVITIVTGLSTALLVRLMF